ncbi:MAG TPA: tRNA (adenosine(37)-N6)-threonylcarbamoyltransferase complex ATPase subunit type 1 TsaE [Clostridia bacterium]|nr:tRNA (adenosine(37)-N6)-threonylcarbamoyltransferase complex ATPase subunit type 1 TsaE [Clostridia bacterium]
MMKVHTNSAAETAAFGRKLGRILQKGDTVCLSGDLGTGKTAFTGGIAQSLGINEYITSPTFTIINEYEGKLPLYHFDVYRIGDAGEMIETGFDDYIGGDGVTVIEWAELIEEILPAERIDVRIEKDDFVNADSRLITVEFHGKTSGYERRLADESIGG